MRNKLLAAFLVFGLGVFSVQAFWSPEGFPTTVDEAIQGWPTEAVEAVPMLVEKYGQPDEISTGQLVWYNTEPFKRTILHRDSALHNFPVAHQDIIEQVIDYKMPLELYDDIAQFDGSVFLNRTAGEMSARCHIIGANLLAINMAHKVAIGELTVEAARTALAAAIQEHQNGNTPESMQQLLFEVPEGDTADPDVSVLK